MARWLRRPEGGLPLWVLEVWVSGDPGGEVDAWLDDLQERDPDLWAEAFIELISVPSYTPGRDGQGGRPG